LSASAARASRDSFGWQAVKISEAARHRYRHPAPRPDRHRLLLLLQVAHQHLVLAREHVAAAQMIQRPAFGGSHQPRAGLVRHAGRGPMFERRQQRFLGEVLGQRHVAQHPGQARDQPRLFDPPDARMVLLTSAAVIAADAEGAACSRGDLGGLGIDLAGHFVPRRGIMRISQVPSQPGMWSRCNCMNSRAAASASSLLRSSKMA